MPKHKLVLPLAILAVIGAGALSAASAAAAAPTSPQKDACSGITDPAEAIKCGSGADAAPVAAPPQPQADAPACDDWLRLRGSPEDLYASRCNVYQAGVFQSASRAKLDFSSDQISGNRKTTATGAIGGVIEHDLSNGSFLDLIPYAAANWSVSRNSKAAGGTISDAKTVDFGAIATAFLINEEGTLGNEIELRPDYLLNDTDESRLFSVNLQYIPKINGLLNTFPRSDGTVQFEFTGNLRADGGFYTDRGTDPTVRRDYMRAGGEAGFTVLLKSLRLNLTASYVYLAAFEGGRDIGYLKSELTYGLDDAGNLGISFDYSNGRREDTGDKERRWEIALTARY